MTTATRNRCPLDGSVMRDDEMCGDYYVCAKCAEILSADELVPEIVKPAYNKQAVLKLALAIVPVIRREMIQRDEDYRAECIQSYKDGYAPHYCKHGVNMWVDYDCACWRCEVGDDDLENAPEIALREARQAVKECQRRKDKTWDAAMDISKTDWKLTIKMLDYMLDPMTNLLKQYKIETNPVKDVFLSR